MLRESKALSTEDNLTNESRQHVASCCSPSVHVICDVTSIEDFTKHVSQVIPGHSLVGLQVVEQHISTGGQITHVERVPSAEP